jgi:hypothetical protein
MSACPPCSTVPEVSGNKKVVSAVRNILKEIVDENRQSPNIKNEHLEKQKKLSFHSKNPASISVGGYLERLLKYTHIEESTLIIALIYIDRICEFNNIYLVDSNIHRVMFTGIIMAIKYNEDDFYTNSYYSKVGGISTRELNLLEYEFVKLLKYNLFINRQTYDKYNTYLYHYNKKVN